MRGVWTFTAYIIWRLSQAKRSDRIYVSELVHFIFDILWRRYKVVLNTNSEELEREIEFLDEIGAVDFNDYEIRIKEGLREVAKIVERSALRDQLTLYRKYVETIDQAVSAFSGR